MESRPHSGYSLPKWAASEKLISAAISSHEWSMPIRIPETSPTDQAWLKTEDEMRELEGFFGQRVNTLYSECGDLDCQNEKNKLKNQLNLGAGVFAGVGIVSGVGAAVTWPVKEREVPPSTR